MDRSSRFFCFGLQIDGQSFETLLPRILDACENKKQLAIVTANAEILLEAKGNLSYRKVLDAAHLRLVDSVSLACLGRLKGAAVTRLPGIDLAERLLEEAERREWRVALIGGDPENAQKALIKIRSRYPQLALFAERGGEVSVVGKDDLEGEETRFRLTQFAPHILLVGFGFPRQEAWIHRYQQEFPTAHVAVGVGGTIDYWSGTKQRAPRWMQNIGLEWLWRLWQEPWRAKRIARAVFVFPVVVLWQELKTFFIARRPDTGRGEATPLVSDVVKTDERAD